MAGELKTAFQKIAKTISDAAGDLSSLNVTTVSGDVDKVIKGTDKKLNFEELSKSLNATGTNKVNAKLVAHTHIKFDQDTFLFVRDMKDDNDRELFQLHLQAIESANKARMSFLHMLKEIVD